MRRFLLAVLSIPLLAAMTSCLGDTDYTYYDDAAITAFYLGTLNRYYTVTKESGDSIYKRTLDCSGYTFNIDHLAGLIWNSDSLPIEVDASKVVCTVTSRNGGTIAIKSMTSDSLFYYSSTDSLDFTEPRDFYVYGTSGMTLRHYVVSVNVHQEVGDTCIWTPVSAGNSALAALEEMKGLSNGKSIYLFGSDGEQTRVYTTAVDDGASWEELPVEPLLEVGASKSTILKGDTFFTYSEGQVLRSDDAQYWEAVSQVELRQLLGASRANLYALSEDGKILISSDEGASWAEEELDDDSALLPTEDISFACRALETNANTDKLVLIGNRSVEAYPEDETAVVWSKVDEYSEGARSNKWNYVAFAADNYNNRAPRAYNWQIVNYDENNIKAVCGDGKKGSDAVAFDRIYHSGDDGITWRNDSVMCIPEGLSSSHTSFAFVADNVDSVWLICGGTGQVWKGRINRVAWKKDPDYFIE